MDEADAVIHKPLLLEEFGKIVWEKDYDKGYIESKRNPVYQAMTGVTMDSVKKCVSRQHSNIQTTTCTYIP